MSRLRTKIANNLFLTSFVNIYRRYFFVRRRRFGFIDKTARVRYPITIKGIENVYLYEHAHILGNATIISTRARFIMKKYSGSAEGLTVVTGNHFSTIGEWRMTKAGPGGDEQVAKDVIVEEDVWLAANVTLLSGVTIGRGSIVGAGAVVRTSIPPYSIVIGNPAKIVGFVFNPDEVIEHEKALYEPDERLSRDLLEINYGKYFINRINDIKHLLKL